MPNMADRWVSDCVRHVLYGFDYNHGVNNQNGRTSGRDIFLIVGLCVIVSCCGFPILGEISKRLENATSKNKQPKPTPVIPTSQNQILDFMKQFSDQSIRSQYPNATIVFGEMLQGKEGIKTVTQLHGQLKMYGTANELDRPWTTTMVSLKNTNWMKAVCKLDEASSFNSFRDIRIDKPTWWVE